MNLDPDNVTTLAGFARVIGSAPSYGSQLKRDGRLVMHPDGKRVLIAESKARMAATKDPSKQGVVDRHAAARAAALVAADGVGVQAQILPVAQAGGVPAVGPVGSRAVPPAPTFPVLEGEPGGFEMSPAQQYSYQDAKAKREHWAAEREHAAWRKEAGELMERGEVVAAFADAGATLRSKLEAWAAVLPPQLVGRDEAAIRATVADQVERLLHDLVAQFGSMAGGEA